MEFAKGIIYHADDQVIRKIPSRIDHDTGKKGLYFSSTPMIAELMSVEYDRPLFINVCVVIKDTLLYNGKYSFRNINPQKYFNSEGDLIINQHPTQIENISHFDMSALPIIDWKNNVSLPSELIGFEIFISDGDIENISWRGAYQVSPSEIKMKYKNYLA